MPFVALDSVLGTSASFFLRSKFIKDEMMVNRDVESISNEQHYQLLTESKFVLQQIDEEDIEENDKIWKQISIQVIIQIFFIRPNILNLGKSGFLQFDLSQNRIYRVFIQ